MEDDEPNQVLFFPRTKKGRAKLFFKTYWRILVVVLTPLVLCPIASISSGRPYKCFYVFLVTAVYLIADVFPTCVTALVPMALSTFLGLFDSDFYMTQVYLRSGLLDCLGVMMLMVAIEQTQVHKRLALKLLIIFGCRHYRLSFLLFFTTMFLSMWMTNTVTCGLMIPLVKATLEELEKMGILEFYFTIDREISKTQHHGQAAPRPTDFTVFYFLGIAYSSTIGGMATLSGSTINQIFKAYCETIFPSGTKIEFPHFMLLNLPEVLLMESLLYMWMNFHFLGMFLGQSEIALQIGLTEEEAQYINALLIMRYEKLDKINFCDIIVSGLVVFAALLQTVSSALSIEDVNFGLNRNQKFVVPTLISALLLFLIPTELNYIKHFLRIHGTETQTQLPALTRRSCLNWNLVNETVHWNVLLIIAGSTAVFESLRESNMTEELEKFLLLIGSWSAPAQALVVIVVCKVLTEFAPNSCVAYTLLPSVARLSIQARTHPHYLMLAATLASSLPFHLATGTPGYALVRASANIPPWKMMCAGVGPSIIAVVVTWFTVAVWSKAIWTDIYRYPDWADDNVFKIKP